MVQMSNLDDHVREALRTKILTGELGGGAHLSELKLSKEFNVSRTPIREALCALAADGLIEMVPHRGAFVTDMPEETASDKQVTYGLLWSMVARVAAERTTIESTLELENSISSISTADDDTFLKGISGVLSVIRQIAQSPTMADILTVVERRMNTPEFFAGAVQNKTAIAQEFSYLLAAFKRGKGDVADKTMRQIMNLIIGTEIAATPKKETEAADTTTVN